MARLGVIARLEGDFSRAWQFLDEALAHLRAGGFRYGIWAAVAALGDLAAAEGDDGAAGAHYRAIVTEAREWGLSPGWELGLAGLGLLAVTRGDDGWAVGLLGAVTPAQVARTRIYAPYAAAAIEAGLATCRASLGDAAFETARRRAQAMSLPDLVAEALDEPPSAPAPGAAVA